MPQEYLINGKTRAEWELLSPKTLEQWTALNPIIPLGEIVFELGTGKHKTGDGVTHWLGIAYDSGPPSVPTPSTVTTNFVLTKIEEHVEDSAPHPIYDDGPSLVLLYENAKV